MRLLLFLCLLTSTAHADVVFTREGALYRGETKLADVSGDVRALRTDGTTLLADLSGTWHWLPLAGGTPTPLPCTGHPTLHPSGTCVVCAVGATTAFIRLENGLRADRPLPDATVTTDLRLIWSDGGIWSATYADPSQKTLLAPESPLRSLSISPDGARAVGVYPGTVGRKQEPGELLYTFALDGTAARRKTIRNGVPIQWSADGQWLLIEDGARACVMRVVGGQYKCWKGYTATSLSPDGAYALLLGHRRGESKPDPKEPAAGAAAEGESDDATPVDDESIPLPTGPLSLYRAELAGAYTTSPTLLERVVDGAAIWLP